MRTLDIFLMKYLIDGNQGLATGANAVLSPVLELELVTAQTVVHGSLQCTATHSFPQVGSVQCELRAGTHKDTHQSSKFYYTSSRTSLGLTIASGVILGKAISPGFGLAGMHLATDLVQRQLGSPHACRWAGEFSPPSIAIDFVSEVTRGLKSLPNDWVISYAGKHMDLLERQRNVLSIMNSSEACLACMWRVPTVKLLCDHWLCKVCCNDARQFYQLSGTAVTCLLCGKNCSWEMDKISTTSAGFRVLSLDEGGVRGVVMLEILTALQQHLHGLPFSQVCSCLTKILLFFLLLPRLFAFSFHHPLSIFVILLFMLVV